MDRVMEMRISELEKKVAALEGLVQQQPEIQSQLNKSISKDGIPYSVYLDKIEGQ